MFIYKSLCQQFFQDATYGQSNDLKVQNKYAQDMQLSDYQ